jgi:hypothetical protein
MDAGDVAEIVSRKGASSDLSGTLVSASNPVQVISGVPCINQPFGSPACDHIEETVSPAETLGQSYLVAPPTGPKGKAVGHIVRIFGNQDGTNLVFEPSKPPGCPDTIDAGQVVECGKVETAFRVRGDKNFAVASILLGGSIVSPGDPIFGLGGGLGDPSLSLAVPVEQYRKKYLFLAPNDYDLSFADVIAPIGAVIRVDDMPVSVKDLPIGSTGFGTLRVKLGAGKQGAHTLESDRPVGLQVLGYGQYTSYYYPGGLNLGVIAPPPPR